MRIMDMPIWWGAIARYRATFWPVVALRGLIDLVLQWQCRIEERQRLAELDEYMLKDIGLNRVDALRESTKPFWRP